MEILVKEFNGIEYYLIDTYKTEFSFGVVYHFASDEDEKFCFFRDNIYTTIKNKLYLRRIKKEVTVNSDILFKVNPKQQAGNIRMKHSLFNEQRLGAEEEYFLYDEASKAIHELFSDISYEESMEILNNDSGIYYGKLKDAEGTYSHRKWKNPFRLKVL